MLPSSSLPSAQSSSDIKSDSASAASSSSSGSINFEQKAKALSNQFDEMDKTLGVSKPTSTSEQKSFTNLPKGLTMDDMSFWLQYRDQINYAQPTPFSVPQQKKPIKAKAAKKKKDQPLIEEIDEKSKNSSTTKVFCLKRKRNEEPLETFYIPSIQQSKKTKMSDLEKQFAATSLNKKKDPSSFAMEPSFSLYKFTIVKSDKKVEEKQKLSEQSSLKQVTNIKAKTTERSKTHESDMKKKRMLRISEMRNEGNKQIVELQVLSGEQTEKKEEKVDLSNYASMLDEIYGKGATESMQNICDNEFEVDYYTVETCDTMDDIDSENYEEKQNVLRFERFDDQLWLESNLEDEYGFAQDDEYDSEDSNASGNPNNEYPDDADSEEDDEYSKPNINNYNYNDIYGYPDDGEEEWEEDEEDEEDDDEGMDDFDF